MLTSASFFWSDLILSAPGQVTRVGGANGTAPACRAVDPGSNPGSDEDFSFQFNNIGPIRRLV